MEFCKITSPKCLKSHFRDFRADLEIVAGCDNSGFLVVPDWYANVVAGYLR
jgi:hypothetical protein